MTPDMQRLCEAVQLASNRSDIKLTRDDAEVLVRAVLTALREPSEGMIDAGAAPEISTPRGTDYAYLPIGFVAAQEAFPAMIDHVLAEPSRA